MGKYIESSLMKDEKIVYEGKLSLWPLFGPMIVLGAIIATFHLFGLVIVLFGILSGWIKYVTTEMGITNKRVIAKWGLIRRETIEMNISKVESIQVKQGIFGRILNFGTLIISGAGNPQAPIDSVSLPMEFKKAFMTQHDNNEG